MSQLCNRFRDKGYTVWTSVHDKGGYDSKIDLMAEAVENAGVVMICMSEKYKLSQNCRTGKIYLLTSRTLPARIKYK